MSEYGLGVELREGVGKGVARKLRAEGRVPGVCYGGGAAPQSIVLDPRALERLIASSDAGLNTLIDLKVEGGGAFDGKKMLIKELQRDPLSGELLHADLYAVNLEQTIEVSVPIHLTGSAAGVLMGGILDHALRAVELECLPQSIPDEITLDVSALEIGDSLHVRDLMLPEGVALVSDPELSVVSVMAPTVEEEPTAEVPEGEAAAEAAEGEAPAEGEKAAEGAEKAEESGGD